MVTTRATSSDNVVRIVVLATLEEASDTVRGIIAQMAGLEDDGVGLSDIVCVFALSCSLLCSLQQVPLGIFIGHVIQRWQLNCKVNVLAA